MELKFDKVKYILLIGIGGSDLASKAVWNAVTLHKTKINKKVLFLESPDSREYEELKYLVKNDLGNLEEVVLITISKSGETEETLTAFRKVYKILEDKFGEYVNKRTIIISTKDSTLYKIGEEKDIETLEWQSGVGGRFSAFTTAHKTVLQIAGLNVTDFLNGSEEAEKEEVIKLSKNIFESYKKNQTDILDLFLFNSELEDLGKWCRQLIAESLGKTNKHGIKVGITPTVSIGPVDLHSMLQLDLGGPKNKFTIFVASLKEIQGINQAAYENVSRAYNEALLPFYKYEMNEINERELGKFMSLMMQVTIKLGDLLEVNPFDQPDVENYKESLKHE